MSKTRRAVNGLSNVPSGRTLSQFLDMDHSLMHVFFEDFNRYRAAEWKVTADAGGSQAILNVDGGKLFLLNDGDDNDGTYLQLSGDGGTTTNETFLFETGKKFWFRCRYQLSEDTQSEYLIGLHTISTDPIDTAPTDGVWFQKDDGDTNIDFHVVKNSSFTSATALATETQVLTTVGFYYDGGTKIHYFFNNSEAGVLDADTLPNDEELAISMAVQNGDGNARSLSIDYILAAKER